MKSENLEEVGWAISGPVSKVDLQTVFENCPNLHRFFINNRRNDIRNIPLTSLV